ncbi:unnamed protein product [marine sediment metagenome]|uniref:Uncharacterized protein n=1 Tax=marine sediment metagenome TaxID=412755 RepID=X1LU39_9ZZZZ
MDLDGILLSTDELAATLLLGVDVFRNCRKQTDTRWRQITGITIVGSTALRDFEIDLYAGDKVLGHFVVNVIGGGPVRCQSITSPYYCRRVLVAL